MIFLSDISSILCPIPARPYFFFLKKKKRKMKTYLFLPIPLPPCTFVSLFLWTISAYYINQEEISLYRIYLHAILFNFSLVSGSSHFHPYIYYHFCIVKYFVYRLQFNFNGSGFQESLQCLWRNSWICSKDRSNNSHLLIFSD